MTTLQDGPAKGQHLMLRRAARFLRVTEADGKFDALDQLEDEPKPDEKLHAYEIVEELSRGHCHINAGGGRGGFYPIAVYRLVKDQPSDEQMRIFGNWGRWCKARVGLA